MNFRQRVAWLMLFAYLSGTFIGVYYLFEFSERYGDYAYEHVAQCHSKARGSSQDATVLWEHLADIPFFVWILLASIPYFQFFFVLYMCTKSQPRSHIKAYVVPIAGFFCVCFSSETKETLQV